EDGGHVGATPASPAAPAAIGRGEACLARICGRAIPAGDGRRRRPGDAGVAPTAIAPAGGAPARATRTGEAGLAPTGRRRMTDPPEMSDRPTAAPERRRRDAVVLVDEHDRPLGVEAKLKAHEAGGRLHRAFSVFIFDAAGRMLL